MNTQTQATISLTEPHILLSEHYYKRLWLAVKNLDIPRREWLDELADTFRDYHGIILTPNGTPYELPFIDDIFANDDDMRWLGYYLTPDITGNTPKIQTRKVERLQILDLYMRVKWPVVAKHFAK